MKALVLSLVIAFSGSFALADACPLSGNMLTQNDQNFTAADIDGVAPTQGVTKTTSKYNVYGELVK